MMLVRVDAGNHRRRHCPLSVTLPQAAERPVLQVAGRSRPLPCQPASEDPATVWWIQSPLRPHESSDYVLGVSQARRVHARVRIEPSAAGWTVRRRDTPIAELLAPAQGAPRLVLVEGRSRLATVRHRGSQQAADSALPEAVPERIDKPRIENGPVFADLEVDYAHQDDLGRVQWIEGYHLRFFDGPAHLVIVDLSVQWRAVTGGIWVGTGPEDAGSPGQRDHRTPVLSFEVPSGSPGCFTDTYAHRGEELNGARTPMVLYVPDPDTEPGEPDPTGVGGQLDGAVGVFVRSGRSSPPPVWHRRGQHLLECTPYPSALWSANGSAALVSGAASGGVRLALGEQLDFAFRVAAFRAKNPLAFGGGCYLDFECPPRTEVLAEPEGG